MPVLFVSHSSKDDANANVLASWLRANGFTDFFLDHQQIAGGDKWPEALRTSAGSCRVVVCLVTPNWLASLECFNEFGAAWYMGKRIIPLFLLPPSTKLNAEAKTRLDRVCGEDQGIDLTPCKKARRALAIEADQNVASRLRLGLRAAGANSQVGVDPEAFATDYKLRPTPYPGLSSFGDEDADAALFYGRRGEIEQTLEKLRKMRAERDLRPFVILGASGAGKSSLLKAGIIPRLRREAPAWLPLRAFRPGADPLLNFAGALARTFADFGRSEAHSVIRGRLIAAWSKAERADKGGLTPDGVAVLEAVLETEGQALRSAANRPNASILISVDQAEEMARADGKNGGALADYLRIALGTTSSLWQLAFTIRTDSFSELQNHRCLQNLETHLYDLRPLPTFRFDSVVEEPAKRYGIEVDSGLVDALMDDAPKEDALPLLAFALQRLWRQYSASGKLLKENYDKGLIEGAAERALRGLEPPERPEQNVPLPSAPPAKRRVELGASTFVPALVQISDQGIPIRRVAAWKSFNDEQQELLIGFDRWRLVVRKGDVDGGTVEVAHEALFREWARLKGWLQPEQARLEVLRSLQADAATWDRNGRATAFLNHRDKRLAETAALRGIEGYRKRMAAVDLDYLAACQAAEGLARRRLRAVQAVVGVLVLGVVVGMAAWIKHDDLQQGWLYLTVTRPFAVTRVHPFVLKADNEQALKPGDSFRECAAAEGADDCPEMVVVPNGAFNMGSDNNEPGHILYEGPRHLVKITEPFAVGKYEVTWQEWEACVQTQGCSQTSQNRDSGYGKGRKPVINVSWEEAKAYVAWLSSMTGKTYRLLTEAQWEYAARGVTNPDAVSGPYPWGDDPSDLCRHANLADQTFKRIQIRVTAANCDDGWDATAPVGLFFANPFGLYDMHGNVWEWVEDAWHSTYDGTPPSDGSEWKDDADPNTRVVRGGSFEDPPEKIRSAVRQPASKRGSLNNLGFRVARTLLGP
jgi:formylglycine-generating enzyme required for sulfatase activity